MGACEGKPQKRSGQVGKDPDMLDEICAFYFVDAQAVEGFQRKMPRFQDLKAAGHLTEVAIKMNKVVCGAYRHILVVSHCWEDPAYPDPTGKQLLAVQQCLKENPSINMVWLDWMCMPQGSRTEVEKDDFKRMLPRINMLFLGCSVLLLVDISFNSRFWTQFEAWLAFQACSESGIASDTSENARWHIRCLHSASDDLEGERLRVNWRSATPEKALEILSQPDVKVTNTSDKDAQLPKIASLDKVVQNTFAALHNEMQDPTANAQEMTGAKGNTGKGSEFSITFDRTGGARLGIDVDHGDGVSLLIEVIAGGLAEKWNTETPDRALKEGDRIVEVNGIRGDIDILKMVEECTKNKVLEIRVNRRDVPGADITSAEMTMSAGSPAAAAKGNTGKGSEFSITFDRTGGARLGIDVDHEDGVSLLIEVIAGDLAEKWNTENPDRALKEGDRIVEVNGIRGDIDILKMVEECTKNKLLEIRVVRG